MVLAKFEILALLAAQDELAEQNRRFRSCGAELKCRFRPITPPQGQGSGQDGKHDRNPHRGALGLTAISGGLTTPESFFQESADGFGMREWLSADNRWPVG